LFIPITYNGLEELFEKEDREESKNASRSAMRQTWESPTETLSISTSCRLTHLETEGVRQE
jgi:hypothetical protein